MSSEKHKWEEKLNEVKNRQAACAEIISETAQAKSRHNASRSEEHNHKYPKNNINKKKLRNT